MFTLHVALSFCLGKDEEPLEDMEICDNGTSMGKKNGYGRAFPNLVLGVFHLSAFPSVPV